MFSAGVGDGRDEEVFSAGVGDGREEELVFRRSRGWEGGRTSLPQE